MSLINNHDRQAMPNNSLATAKLAALKDTLKGSTVPSSGVPPPTDCLTASHKGIAKAFTSLLEQYQQGKSKIATKEEEAQKKQNQELLAKTSDYTVDQIVNNTASLQLSFGNVVNDLANKLTTESNKEDELEKAIVVEQEHLQQLDRLRLVADALYILHQQQQEKKVALATSTAKEKEVIEQEIAKTRQEWAKEQAEFVTRTSEAAELPIKKRELEIADYQYELQRQRTIEQDEYEEDKRLQTRELSELELTKNKDWSDRQQRLADRQAEFIKDREKVAGFEAKLQEESDRARVKAIKDADNKYKIEAELIEKEWSATERGNELKIESLTTIIEHQTAQIAEITAQLQEANVQAQNLAMQAFGNTGKQ